MKQVLVLTAVLAAVLVGTPLFYEGASSQCSAFEHALYWKIAHPSDPAGAVMAEGFLRLSNGTIATSAAEDSGLPPRSIAICRGGPACSA